MFEPRNRGELILLHALPNQCQLFPLFAGLLVLHVCRVISHSIRFSHRPGAGFPFSDISGTVQILCLLVFCRCNTDYMRQWRLWK